MPEICRFHGIIIRMYFSDHPPPHFHAFYSGHEAVIGIATATLMNGYLPKRAQDLVIQWTRLRQTELLESWERAQLLEPPGKIAPLE